MEKKLKHCSRCGSTNVAVQESERPCALVDSYSKWYHVVCKDCGYFIGARVAADMASADWNLQEDLT